MLTRVGMPHMYSKRSILTTHYSSPPNEQVFETLSSSWGNKDLLSKVAKDVEDDVIGFMHINYVKLEMSKDNPNICKWTSVFCFDMRGMICDDDHK